MLIVTYYKTIILCFTGDLKNSFLQIRFQGLAR